MNVFYQNEPRPPVLPGEETEAPVVRSYKRSSTRTHPPVNPRTSSLLHAAYPDGCRLGFEPEGRSDPPTVADLCSPPGYLVWARNLHSLLTDLKGVELFQRFLKEEEDHLGLDTLNFWFACNGLPIKAAREPDKLEQTIRAIYRKWFCQTKLEIPEKLRKEVHKRMKDNPVDTHLFDKAFDSVERLISETIYPNFLQSEVYLSYVGSMQNGGGSMSLSGSGSGGSSGRLGDSGTLATLHEDKELETGTPSYPPLTKDMLLLTQQRRASSTSPGLPPYRMSHRTGPRQHCSYNPVSRQDSELQSSSDAKTESDTISVNSSVDLSLQQQQEASRRSSQRQSSNHQGKKESWRMMNRDGFDSLDHIPRTERIHSSKLHPMKPDEFASILIKKLEAVKEKQEMKEKLEQRLSNSGEVGEGGILSADAVRLKLLELVDSKDDKMQDQDILDEHCKRVWSDTTPTPRTPGFISPRPKSPDLRRNRIIQANKQMGASSASSQYSHHVPSSVHSHQLRAHPSRHLRSKDKDLNSLFSSDSGNVRDFPEGQDYKTHLPKSKSMPEYSDSQSVDIYSTLSQESRLQRSRGEWVGGSSRRFSKPSQDLDSGVSVSDSVSYVLHGSQSSDKESRVRHWVNESRQGDTLSDRESISSSGPKYSNNRLMSSQQQPSDKMSDVPSSLSGAATVVMRGISQDAFTQVVFTYNDENVPYKTKIPGNPITLAKFKENLPRRGKNYRFYFKMESNEVEGGVINLEVADEEEPLPLWEGRVFASIHKID